MMSPDKRSFFCSDLARADGADLIGTATWGDVWFLLEYAGRWGYKAFEESGLPEAVKEHLETTRQGDYRVRIQLIKQPESSARQGITFFAAQTSELEPRLYQYHLADYEDLLELDLLSLAAGQAGDPANLRHEPLFLGCVNGKRDKCCARYGLAANTAMVEEAGEDVWQSTHIGGHRYAPTLLFFPHGVNYGRATPEEAKVLVRSYKAGDVVLHNYRGRVCYSKPVQAAEHFWRAETGVRQLPGVRLEEVTEDAPDRWTVRFADLSAGKGKSIQVQRRFSDFAVPVSCRGNKQKPEAWFYRLG